MYQIPRATPEATGVPSKAIFNFIKRLEDYQIPMHSLLLARQGKLIYEGYYAPYQGDTLHRMFSISKSFTSIAIGLLVQEGRISLDDRIIDYFPEKLPEEVHPWIAQMTIRNMLMMQTCHTSTTYKIDPDKDWVESFFTTKPSHEPGTVFIYDTSSSHTLCALVEKLTGMPMLDYMRKKFLNQIGFSKDAYIIKDPFGTSMGGSGLMATPRDLMGFAMVIWNGGKLNETQMLPEKYLEEAISYQTDTLMNGPVLSERQGYGYQFWRIPHGGYACYGMGGQLIIFLPKYDLICVTTADTQGIQGGNQLIYESLFEEILPKLSQPLPEDSQGQSELEDYTRKLKIKPLQGELFSSLMASLHQKEYQLIENSSGFLSLSLEFSSDNKEGKLYVKDKRGLHTIAFGFGKILVSDFPIYKQRCATSGIWTKENALYIKSHLIDECIGSVHLKLVFQEDRVNVYMKKIEETYFNEFTGFLYGKVKY